MAREELWLPAELTPSLLDRVSEIGKEMNWEIFEACAFAVAILEEVNAHDEARKVNDVLVREMEREGIIEEMD